MQKELLQIEFRYKDVNKNGDDYDHRTKTVTIGIFDNLEDAIKAGNEMLQTLSEKFEVRHDDRFKKVHLFGSPKRLVTNTCYPTNGIQYFAQIKPLKFDDLNETIGETFNAYKRYKKLKR